MSSVGDFLSWFTGGRHQYMTLIHCMSHDTFWIGLTVILDLAVAAGYLVIARHWWANERPLKESPAKSTLRTMKKIFIFCGLCGYLFIPIKMVWPAWRLYDFFLAALVYFTWRYALNAGQLRVVYNELARSEQLELDLAESREEGRRKSQFLNAVSHDLKTPLNGLMLQAELAELNIETQDPESVRECLAQIKSCARTTADILNSFLELGRLEWSQDSFRSIEFEIATLVNNLADQVRPRADRDGLSLDVRAPMGTIIRTDRVKLERVLLNLVDNAFKFTEKGGLELVVEVKLSDVTIHVADTGEGICVEDQARIFDDFTQVHNRERDSRKGFGLGLSIARRLVEGLGGQISLESQPGRGSRFTVFLPESVVREGAERPAPTSGDPTRKASPALG